MRSNRLPAVFTSAFCLACLSGCSTVGYYAQAVQGHLSLMQAREPIERLLAADDTPEELRDKLITLREARRFAIDVLRLPDNDSYSSYAATGKRYVTWNVVAADEFSVQARTWCFPVAGCVSYRGYFDEADATAYARALVAESAAGGTTGDTGGDDHDGDADAAAVPGVDVTITGASAYSTLGWFDDPVLDTMLRGSELRYVGTLFHELAHQRVYLQDASDFNEAFASFVQQEGIRQWLRFHDEADAIADYEAQLARAGDFVALLQRTRESLTSLYAEPIAPARMRERKQARFQQMRDEYDALKTDWDGYAGYDNWFSRELNNARLVSVATYRRLIPAFATLFDEQGRDIERFYRAVEDLAALDESTRTRELDRLLSGS